MSTKVADEKQAEPKKQRTLNTIIIRSHKDSFVIDLDMFQKYSDKIKKLREQERLPETLDLTHYDVTAVSTLVDYMALGRAQARITTFILGDLMELGHVLEMKVLVDKIEEFILSSSKRSITFLLHVLTMISKDKLLLEKHLGMSVLNIAVFEFLRIIRSTSFYEIPLNIIQRILDRCDLHVNSEMDVAQAAVNWLAARPERVHFSYLLFRCIRIGNLTPTELTNFYDSINQMPHYSKTVTAFAHYVFNESSAYRVCVLAEHSRYKRCGNKNGLTNFSILVPSKQIIFGQKTPVKSSYVTARPKGGKSEDMREVEKSGEVLKRTVFSVCNEKRTTRAERMAAYKRDALQKEQAKKSKQAEAASPVVPASEKQKLTMRVESRGSDDNEAEQKKKAAQATSTASIKTPPKSSKETKKRKKSRSKSRKSAGSSPFDADHESSSSVSSTKSKSMSTSASTAISGSESSRRMQMSTTISKSSESSTGDSSD